MIDKGVKIFFNKLTYLKNSSDRIIVRSLIVKDYLGNLKNSKILDIGCGDGSLSINFLRDGNSITFVDVSEKMLELVKNQVPKEYNSKVSYKNAPFESIIFDQQFDVVLCVGVIAHVESVNTLFNKIDSILRPGGLLVLETTPNPYPIGRLLFPYYWLRNLVVGDAASYKKNRLKIKDLFKITVSKKLNMLRSTKYSFPLPGMSHWPAEFKLRYTLFTLNNPVMSKFGTEHILLFIKQ